MDDWDRLEARLLSDPATREAYEKRRPAFELASKLIELMSPASHFTPAGLLATRLFNAYLQ